MPRYAPAARERDAGGRRRQARSLVFRFRVSKLETGVVWTQHNGRAACASEPRPTGGKAKAIQAPEIPRFPVRGPDLPRASAGQAASESLDGAQTSRSTGRSK